MTVWLAGMEITADRLNDYTPDDSTTTGLTAATGFSVSDFYAVRSKGTVVLDMALSRTGGTISDVNGNITNTDICTVPADWRPNATGTISGYWGDGTASGEFVISPSTGVCTLRTSNGQDIVNGNTMRLHVTFNQDGS